MQNEPAEIYNEDRIEAMLNDIRPTDQDVTDAAALAEDGINPFMACPFPTESPPDAEGEAPDLADVGAKPLTFYADDGDEKLNEIAGDDSAEVELAGALAREIADSVYETDCAEALGEMSYEALLALQDRCQNEGYPSGITLSDLGEALSAARETEG